ncbi:MAG: SDR family NAD(P)-dependent oxidoreductase [Alphaproteobacteria bacterium]|nr:SDR family NAD(P)-dependent oxidoreductase [Alphaproteobacteria bacterium]
MTQVALIVGAGAGLSASLTRKLAARGAKVALAARTTDKLADLVAETGARAYACDAADPKSVDALFTAVDADLGEPDLVVYNPSYRQRGPLLDLDDAEVEKAITISGYGGYLVAQRAARRMEPKGKGTILFTGASASVKGYVNSAPFAMGKFALRGLAQSIARELAPKGIHVAHFIIDGQIWADHKGHTAGDDSKLHPDAIADSYLHIADQPKSAWTWEIELRPSVERF